MIQISLYVADIRLLTHLMNKEILQENFQDNWFLHFQNKPLDYEDLNLLHAFVESVNFIPHIIDPFFHKSKMNNCTQNSSQCLSALSTVN